MEKRAPDQDRQTLTPTSHSLPGRKLARHFTEVHSSSDHHRQKLCFIAQQQVPRHPPRQTQSLFATTISIAPLFLAKKRRLMERHRHYPPVTHHASPKGEQEPLASTSEPLFNQPSKRIPLAIYTRIGLPHHTRPPRCPLFSLRSLRRNLRSGSLVPLPQRQRKPHSSERRPRAPDVLLRDAVHCAAVHKRPPLDPREQDQVWRVLLLLLIHALASGTYASRGARFPPWWCFQGGGGVVFRKPPQHRRGRPRRVRKPLQKLSDRVAAALPAVGGVPCPR
ncbi:unnamed protein product [Ectocarpus sp. 13 AM-2016]